MDDRHRELRITAHAATLRGCSMFVEMAPEDLANIAAIAQHIHAEKGEYIFREGQTVRGFYVVRKGAVSVHRVGIDGSERVLHVFREHQSFAEGALAGPGTYPADARAVEGTDLLFIPRERFLELIRTNAELALQMLASMSQHLRILVNALEDLKGRDVETRLMNWLLKRCPQPPAGEPFDVALDVTKSVLAAELSTRNETLSRALAKLRDAGHIAVDGRRIRIFSPLRLQEQFHRNIGGAG